MLRTIRPLLCIRSVKFSSSHIEKGRKGQARLTFRMYSIQSNTSQISPCPHVINMKKHYFSTSSPQILCVFYTSFRLAVFQVLMKE